MLCPSWLTGELAFAKGVADGGTPAIDQLALADFIARGELDRHLRRMRLQYRRRREAAARALRTALPETRLLGAAAGLFALAQLPEQLSEPAVLRAAAATGVEIEGLGSHRLERDTGPGLLIGYANLAEPAIERGITLLAGAIRSLG
jgi:GntR family transcriptional regulator/MocR family aminotransferase